MLPSANFLVNLGAINKTTRKYETPIFANKKNKYECPDCGQDVILKQGEVRKYHFSHHSSLTEKNQGECAYYSHPGESQIHKHAKELIKAALEKKRCLVWKDCNICHIKSWDKVPKVKETDEILVECTFELEGYRKVADVAILDRDGYIKVIFEIYHTHKTREEDRPEPWYELKAMDVINVIENSEEYFKIGCIRQKVCWMCLKFNELDSQKPEWFMEKDKEDELEWYIRYKLGQRKFYNARGTWEDTGKRFWVEYECERGGYFEYGSPKPDHLRLNFDAQKEDDQDHNKKLIALFSKFYGTKCVTINSHKGTIKYTFQWVNGIGKVVYCSGDTTIGILINILRDCQGIGRVVTYEGNETRSWDRFLKKSEMYTGNTLFSEEGYLLEDQNLTIDELMRIHLHAKYRTKYGIESSKAIPKAISIILFHLASVWVSDILVYPSKNPKFIVGFYHEPKKPRFRFSVSSDCKGFIPFLTWIKTVGK